MTLLRWYQGWDDNDPSTTGIMLQVGGRRFDHYSVYLGEPMIPLNAALSAELKVPTVRITGNDKVIFEGGYQESTGMFFTSDGRLSPATIDGTMYVSGADPWEN